jgi:tripartite-type tricarboxylate transporter receptor subunit TctC
MEITSMQDPDMFEIRRAFLLASLLSGWTLQALAQAAADYPARPVRWIVPTSPGAGTDFAARTFAQLAGEAWKQSVVVDNKSGASGMIGLDALAAAAPDGYTLGFISVSQFLDATLLQKFTFDARKDLTPISLLASTPLILVANAGANINSLQQLISVAKGKPKELNYSSGGSGGITHFAMEIFLKKAGISVTHVPYKGSGPAVVDLLAGQVQLSFSTLPAVLQHVKSGKLRALAVSSDSRSPLAPDVPTFAEAGLPGLSLSTWYGLFGPANMSPDLVDRIAASVTAGARRPATRDKMVSDGIDPILNTPAEFSRFVQAEREQWLGVARSINFKREN